MTEFDPATANTAETAEQARELARAWANGRRSHWNEILDMEPRDSMGPIGDARQRSVVNCAEADAAEVAKWAALAQALS